MAEDKGSMEYAREVELNLEYERGKKHGDDDLRLSQRHCQAQGREINELKSEIAKLRMENFRLRRKLDQAGLPTAYWDGQLGEDYNK